MIPAEVKTNDDLLKLERDNIDTGNSWMLVTENGVTIANQKNGEEATGSVHLTHEEIKQFINFYEGG